MPGQQQAWWVPSSLYSAEVSLRHGPAKLGVRGGKQVMFLCPGFLTGNGIAAFESVPTAIYCFLRCMEPDPEIPSTFNSLQRTLIYSISLGGDTDTIATMAGAIAGAYYGVEQVPKSWQQSCEGYEETDVLAQSLHRVFQESP